MGSRRRTLLVGFAVALFLGTAIYFRLGAMDDSFTTDDRELLRRQFERANLEAMDESASWRMKYDDEAKRSSQYQEELLKLAITPKVKGALSSANERLAVLRKDNVDLQKQVESLTHKVEGCNCSQMATQLQ